MAKANNGNSGRSGSLKAAKGDNSLVFSIDESIYPLDILKQAAFIFIDRCYVHLDREGERFVITLKGKEKLNAAALEALQGEFDNELLNQLVRRQIGRNNQKLREMIVAKALLSATRRDSAESPSQSQVRPWDDVSKEEQDELDKLLAEIESEFQDDPSGIAVPWDEKYGKDGGKK